MGVPGEAGLHAPSEHLDGVDEPHGPVVRTPVGWILPGVHDPDGHQMRFYVSDPEREPDVQKPRRMHEAGTPGAWADPCPRSISACRPDKEYPRAALLARWSSQPALKVRPSFREAPTECPAGGSD